MLLTRATVYTTAEDKAIGVTVQELLDLIRFEKVTIIDVREPWELRTEGKIAGSINIPGETDKQGNIPVLGRHENHSLPYMDSNGVIESKSKWNPLLENRSFRDKRDGS